MFGRSVLFRNSLDEKNKGTLPSLPYYCIGFKSFVPEDKDLGMVARADIVLHCVWYDELLQGNQAPVLCRES
jgi:hypothetical protein